MTAPAPIIGRVRELAMLRSVVDSVRAGKSRIAFVEGEAGIGKSRLLAEALEAADVSGVLVLEGKADELHGARPFGAIADALAGWPPAPIPRQGVIDTVLPDSNAIASPADIPGPQFRVVDVIVELLEETALRSPVIVALDDLQWADHATLLTVRAIASRLRALPVGLLGAFRPVPTSPALDGIVDWVVRTGGVHVRVGSLSPEEVTELARRHIGDEPGPKLLHRVAGAAGNPLFVSEMLAALVEEGAITGDAGVADVQDVALPAPLRLTILRRMSGLSEVTLETLRAAATLGATFAVADLVAVTGRTALELSSILSEPLRARIVEEAGARLRFRHDMIRDAIYQDLPLGLRQELHGQAARAFVLAGRPPVEVAQQYLLGASPNDQDAVAWLRRAADAAATRAPASAIEFLQRAADLTLEGDPQCHRIRVQLADLLAYSGRPTEAEALAQSLLLGGEDPTQDGRLIYTLIQALFAQGRWREIPVVAAATLVRPTVDDATRARVLAESALAHIWTGELDAAEADAQQALRLGEEAGDRVAMWNALGNLSGVADKRGRFHEGVALAQRGLDLARRAGTDAQRRNPYIALAMALVTADRLDEAIDVLQEGRLQGERLGILWDLPLYHAMVSLPLQSLGQWDRAVAEAEAALACAEEVGAGGGRVGALGTLARIAIRRNRLDEAAQHVDLARTIIDQLGPQWGSVPVVGLLEAQGDLDEATRRLSARWESAVRRGIVEGQVGIGPELVRLALATGSRAYAHRVAEALETLAAMVNVPVADAGALLSKGRLSGDPETLLAAIEAYRKGHRAPALADAGEVAAVALAHAGRSSEAVLLLEETVTTFEALGAQRDLARVRNTMRELGLRRGTRSPHRTARSGWDSLTATESEIVTLTAQGLTNPEIGRRLFISPRTVQSHLSHIFLKLGVASRVELAARAASRVR